MALAECCFDTGGLGLDVDLPAATAAVPPAWTMLATLFGEAPSRILVSVAPSDLPALLRLADGAGVPARSIGRTGGSRLRVAVEGRPGVDLEVGEAETIWKTTIERDFRRRVA